MSRKTLDHASVRIGNLQRSREFYEGLLGLALAPRPELGFPGAWYALGEGQLHLIERQPMEMGRIDPTNTHFAIRVDDLDAVRRRLDEAGVERLDPGGQQLWVLDPDGNTVELCSGARRS